MSMNANILIEEFVDIVDDDRYEDTEIALRYLNQANRALADTLLLPDLKSGVDTINTVVGEFLSPLPAEYHRNLYLAFSGGKPLNTHKDISEFPLINGGLSKDVDDVTGVAPFGRNLVYQGVPATVTAIEIFFYRFPVAMIEEDTSFPDGLVGNDDFDWAIIHLAAAKAFDRIEDGFEGAKVNTESHKAQAGERIALIDRFCEKDGELFAYRPDAGIGWLGVK